MAAHLGGKLNFTFDSRKDKLLPDSGVLISINASTFRGAGDNARDYGQITPLIAIDRSLNAAGTIVVSDRVGGIVSLGNPAFYQLASIMLRLSWRWSGSSPAIRQNAGIRISVWGSAFRINSLI